MFFDWCGNRPRMLALIGLLLICSLFIIFFGEYVEENLGTNKLFRRQLQTDSTVENTVNNKISEEEKQNSFCISKIAPTNLTTNFTISVVQDCQKCSDFEKNALQIEHCNPTGFYNTFVCTDNLNNNSTIYMPCFTKSNKKQLFSFYTFAFISFLCTLSSWTFVRWRREFLEQRSFGHSYYFQRVTES
ncbi:hypothetical protein Mgra_00007539 [Meloidogyne graminicola]|uniref:Jumping translocation breakpoint protein n=1 Tax=Meloidogyne graminicola TaxID=189291 RepID=A0A8S9ZIJ9_9BILA|nr:hypothetical protein Mgra_00007539 [Meloidogyne graminicola]